VFRPFVIFCLSSLITENDPKCMCEISIMFIGFFATSGAEFRACGCELCGKLPFITWMRNPQLFGWTS
jgi:hypothetical protein